MIKPVAGHRQLPAVVRFNVWQLCTLTVPLLRLALYVTGVAPGQLSEQVLPKWVQAAGLSVLGLGALVALVGVLRQVPIVERLGLRLLWPVAVAYAGVLLYADPRRGAVWLVVYGSIAVASWSRGREITQAMRLTNRVLRQRGGDRS